MASKKNSSGNGASGHQVIKDMSAAEAASMQYRIPMIHLASHEIDRDVIACVSEHLCRRHRVIPVSRAGTSLIVARVDPSDASALDALRGETGYNIESVIADESDLLAAIDKYYGPKR